MPKTNLAAVLVRLPRLLTLVSLAAVSLTLIGTCGCDVENATPVSVSHLDGIESLPPQQIHRALEQLSASDARQQTLGLEFAESFPSLTETHRPLIEKLVESGATPAVKRKASALLEQ